MLDVGLHFSLLMFWSFEIACPKCKGGKSVWRRRQQRSTPAHPPPASWDQLGNRADDAKLSDGKIIKLSLIYKLPTFHYVPFWNLWASSVEFQRQDPKLHYNHWAFNEIPLFIRPAGSRQFPAAGSPIESWSVAAGYSDLLPDALFTQCTNYYTKALLLKIFTKNNFIMARDL